MKKIESVLEEIGQALFDANSEKKPSKETSSFLSMSRDAYVPVQWPDSQALMDEEWFAEEAILDVEGKFGSSAYFIPIKRLL